MTLMFADVEARFGQLNDPLQQSERTRIEEDRTAMQCVTGERFSSADIERLRLPATPLLSLSRQGTSWKQWTRVNACNIESPEHQKSRSLTIFTHFDRVGQKK